MRLFLNELSVHGQFPDVKAFEDALDQVMEMRKVAGRFRRSVYCDYSFKSRQVTSNASLQRVIQQLELNKRRAIMNWIDTTGPFWNEERKHGVDDWLQADGELITDSALGEAAFNLFVGTDSRILSFIPSRWSAKLINVEWLSQDTPTKFCSVRNYIGIAQLQQDLRIAPLELSTWPQLQDICRDRFKNVIFGPDAFTPLLPCPFASSAAESIIARLTVLDKMKTCFDEHGNRNSEGHSLYEQHFVGDNGWFSDSSDTEKRDFGRRLSFRHPEHPEKTIPCTWHGKVRTLTLRIHYSTPISLTEPLYVMYVGPKLTKK